MCLARKNDDRPCVWTREPGKPVRWRGMLSVLVHCAVHDHYAYRIAETSDG